MNKVVLSKNFLDDIFITELTLFIRNKNLSQEAISDLFYILAGLKLAKKEYVECFEILSEWYKLEPDSPRLTAYLTLAELNAFEIEDCGIFLKRIEPDTKVNRHIEISQQLFKATELADYNLFKSIVEDISIPI